jgi:hypothetical protein
MKLLNLLLLGLAGCIAGGCESVVRSTKETALPKTTEAMTGIRYYLPRGRVEVSASWNVLIPGWQPTVKTLIEADPTACYVVERNGNAFFDDDISIQVDPTTGLLQSASASSTDESISALSNLASGAAAALTFGANMGAALSPGKRGKSPEEMAAEQAEFAEVTNNAISSMFDLVVDTHHPKQIYYLVEPDAGSRTPSPKLYAKYTIEIKKINEGDLPEDEPSPATNAVLNGIVIRTPVPHSVSIAGTFYRDGVRMRQQTTTQIVMLPDDDRDYFLPLARIPLVTTSTKVTLVNGMVQSLQRVRPSMVNAIAAVPKNILSALIPLPLAINQYNNNSNNHFGGSTSPSGTAASNTK